MLANTLNPPDEVVCVVVVFGSKVPLEVSPVKAPKVGRWFEESIPPKVDDGSVWLEAVEGELKAPDSLLSYSWRNIWRKSIGGCCRGRGWGLSTDTPAGVLVKL